MLSYYPASTAMKMTTSADGALRGVVPEYPSYEHHLWLLYVCVASTPQNPHCETC